MTTTTSKYSDYESKNQKSLTQDYYQLGNLPGFETEVSTIETFVKSKVENNELPDDSEAVKKAIKKIEDLIDVSDKGVNTRIGAVKSYVEFLNKCDKSKFTRVK
jgi:hypothetical protein